MEITTKAINDILKRIRDYCEINTSCESCPFLTLEEKTPPGISPLNSFCELGFESLHPLLPYQWPIEDWQKDAEISKEKEMKSEEDDTILY